MQRIFSDPEDNEVDDQKGNAQKQGDLHRMFQGAQANVTDPAALPVMGMLTAAAVVHFYVFGGLQMSVAALPENGEFHQIPHENCQYQLACHQKKDRLPTGGFCQHDGDRFIRSGQKNGNQRPGR